MTPRLAKGQHLSYIVHRSNAVLDRAVCFLGRFLPKLGGAASAANFFHAPARAATFFARRAISPDMLLRTAVKLASRSIRASSI